MDVYDFVYELTTLVGRQSQAVKDLTAICEQFHQRLEIVENHLERMERLHKGF